MVCPAGSVHCARNAASAVRQLAAAVASKPMTLWSGGGSSCWIICAAFAMHVASSKPNGDSVQQALTLPQTVCANAIGKSADPIAEVPEPAVMPPQASGMSRTLKLTAFRRKSQICTDSRPVRAYHAYVRAG
jgi:hypothetical protein